MDKSPTKKSLFYKGKTSAEGKIISGKYRYLKVLGTGGMGEVHLVMDIETGQKMAVKCCFDPIYAKRFEQEVHSWIRLGKHPNLVTAFYFDVMEHVPTLFIEYIEGTDLKHIIAESADKKQDIPLDIVLDYAIQICRAVGHLHRSGVIHRDLKPSNILIATEPGGPGRIKITDMGLSKIKGSAASKEATVVAKQLGDDLTQTFEMLGTPQYMSPQQYAFSKGVDEETDIYAFGLILYEMLTQGKKPFQASDSQGWFYAHTYAAPQHVKTQVSSRFTIFGRKSRTQLYNLVMQCLSKEADQRPQGFGQIEEQLLGLYIKIKGADYSRDVANTGGDLSGEELNNQAVSLLEMGAGYTVEGRKKLEELCSSAPECLEAQLNRLLFKLKNNEIALPQFWQEGIKLTTEDAEDRVKVIAVLVGAALERGSYYTQSMELLKTVDNLEHPLLLRIQAKWHYLTGRHAEAARLLEQLCQGEYYQGEDFYHLAGTMVYGALEDQKAKPFLQKGRFSVEFDSQTKQKIWYVLREGEEKCGPSAWLERGKDISIGALINVTPFWHEHAVLVGHSGAVTSLAIAADARYAISGSADKTIRLWDVQAHTELAILEGHSDIVTSVNMDAQSRYAISGAHDGAVVVWDLETRRSLVQYNHNAPVTWVALQLERQWAISAGKDGYIRAWNLAQIGRPKNLWNIFQKKEAFQWNCGHGSVVTADMGVDGKNLIAGCEDGTLVLWNLALTKQSPMYLAGHPGAVNVVKLSADGKWAVSGSSTGEHNVFVWDLHKQAKLLSFPGAKYGIHSLAIAANAYWIFVSSDDGILHVWDLKWQKGKLAVLQGHAQPVCDLAASLQGDMVLSAGEDTTIRIWQNSFVWPLIREQKYLKVTPHTGS